MIEISNSFMKAGFDDSGRLAYLENLKEGNGNIIECPAAIFRMVMKEGDNWEITASSGDQDISVEKRGDRVFICADGLRVKDHRLDIRVTLTASLTDSHLIFSADIVNLSDATIVDFMFPRIGTIKSLAGGKPMLYWPKSSGEVITDIGGKLARMGSPYYEYNMLSMSYPSPASMQWMALADGDQLLYFGSHDSDFYACALRVIGKNSDPGSVIMDFSKHVFVKPQERWQGKQFVLSLFKGTWRHGADIYRAWAEEWFPAPRKPEWVQNMLGYFLVINKQQYGDVMWPYDTLPELWEYAAAHGCDTLGLFGWYAAGHDNQYPYLSPGEDMGGLQKLIDNIRKVREKGGRVTLYCQGHLIDITTEYYKKEGVKVEARSLWGTPYFEQYNKYHESEYLKNYTKKTFSTACPSCPE